MLQNSTPLVSYAQTNQIKQIFLVGLLWPTVISSGVTDMNWRVVSPTWLAAACWTSQSSVIRFLLLVCERASWSQGTVLMPCHTAGSTWHSLEELTTSKWGNGKHVLTRWFPAYLLIQLLKMSINLLIEWFPKRWWSFSWSPLMLTKYRFTLKIVACSVNSSTLAMQKFIFCW